MVRLCFEVYKLLFLSLVWFYKLLTLAGLFLYRQGRTVYQRRQGGSQGI